jgi:hypothetical protein
MKVPAVSAIPGQVVSGWLVPVSFGGDVGPEQPEADRDEFLGALLGLGAAKAGAGEPPDDDDAGQGFDAAVETEAEQGRGCRGGCDGPGGAVTHGRSRCGPATRTARRGSFTRCWPTWTLQTAGRSRLTSPERDRSGNARLAGLMTFAWRN